MYRGNVATASVPHRLRGLLRRLGAGDAAGLHRFSHSREDGKKGRRAVRVRHRGPVRRYYLRVLKCRGAFISLIRLVAISRGRSWFLFRFWGRSDHDAPRRSNGREGRLPLHRAARRRRAVHDQGDRELLLGASVWVRGLLESGGRGDGVGADRHPPVTAAPVDAADKHAPSIAPRNSSVGAKLVC